MAGKEKAKPNGKFTGRTQKYRAKGSAEREEFLLNFEQACKKNVGIVSQICLTLDISRQTFYEWMRTDDDLRQAYVDADEAVNDFTESKLLENIRNGDQRAIEYRLNNRRPHKWRSRGLLQEPDAEESLDITRLFEDASRFDQGQPGSLGPDN